MKLPSPKPKPKSTNPLQNKAIPLTKSAPARPASRKPSTPKVTPSAPRSTRNSASKTTSLNLILAGVIAVVVVLAALTFTWLFS